MGKIVNQFGVVKTVLAADVANNGTFTIGYPTGFSQKSFLKGLDAGGHSMTINHNDKYVVGSGFTLSYGASNITVTNTSGSTLSAGSSAWFQFNQQPGNDIEVVVIPVDLATVTGAQDVLTTWQPGFAGTIESQEFRVNKPVTTAAKAATISPFINATAVTGGAVALTSANSTPMGAVIAGSAITGLNSFGAADTISLKSSAVTAFSEGSGEIILRLRKAPNNFY